jgi:hypothetical protein
MGDNLLEGQVKNSRKRRDRAMTEMQLPSLLYRPELVRQVFTVKPVGDEEFREGEILLAVPTDDEPRIGVIREYNRIGIIDGEGAIVLGQALADTGVAKLKIEKVLTLSGQGQAVIFKD